MSAVSTAVTAPEAASFAGDPRLDPSHNRLKVEGAAMLLIGHQENFFPGIKSIDRAELCNNIVAFGGLAAARGA